MSHGVLMVAKTASQYRAPMVVLVHCGSDLPDTEKLEGRLDLTE